MDGQRATDAELLAEVVQLEAELARQRLASPLVRTRTARPGAVGPTPRLQPRPDGE